MAATKNEGLGKGGIRRARGEGGVVHEAVEEFGVISAGGGDRGEVGVEEEVGGDGRRAGRGSGGGGGSEAGEVVDGGADSGELVEEVVGHRRGRGRTVVLGGGKVVERENIGGHHGKKKDKVQTQAQPHLLLRFLPPFLR